MNFKEYKEDMRKMGFDKTPEKELKKMFNEMTNRTKDIKEIIDGNYKSKNYEYLKNKFDSNE